MSIKHFELHQRWLADREREVTDNMVAEAQDHLLHASVLGESSDDVEDYLRMAAEEGIKVKTRAPRRPKPEEVAKRYPDAGVFDWKTPELVQAVQDEGFMADVAKAELERRTKNRIAKAEGREPEPPSDIAKTLPVEIAKRQFDESKVKRDADGKFSRTEEAKRPRPPEQKRRLSGGDFYDKVFGSTEETKKGSVAFTRASLVAGKREFQEADQSGWKIADYDVPDSERMIAAVTMTRGDRTLKFAVQPDGKLMGFPTLNGEHLNLSTLRNIYEPGLSEMAMVLSAGKDVVEGPDGGLWLSGDPNRSGIHEYRRVAGGLNDAAVTFYGSGDPNELREMMDAHWTGEAFDKDMDPRYTGRQGPLKSRLYRAYSRHHSGLMEMGIGDIRTLSQKDYHKSLHEELLDAIGVDDSGEEMLETARSLDISGARNLFLEVAEDAAKKYDEFVTPELGKIAIDDEKLKRINEAFGRAEERREYGETSYTDYLGGNDQVQWMKMQADSDEKSLDAKMFFGRQPVSVMLDGDVTQEELVDALEAKARLTIRMALSRDVSEHYASSKAAEYARSNFNYEFDDLRERIDFVDEADPDDFGYMENVSDRLYQKAHEVHRLGMRVSSYINDHVALSGKHDDLEDSWSHRDDVLSGIGEDLQKIEGYSDAFKAGVVYFAGQRDDSYDILDESGHLIGRMGKKTREFLKEAEEFGDATDYLERLIDLDYSPEIVWEDMRNGNGNRVIEASAALAALRESRILGELSGLEFHDADVVDALKNHGEGKTRLEHPLVRKSDEHFGLENKSDFQHHNMASLFKARIQQELTDGVLARDEGEVAEVIDTLEEMYVAQIRQRDSHRFDDPVKRMADVRDVYTDKQLERIFGDAVTHDELEEIANEFNHFPGWDVLYNMREVWKEDFDSDERINDPNTFIGSLRSFDLPEGWQERMQEVADEEMMQVALDSAARDRFKYPGIDDSNTIDRQNEGREEFIKEMTNPRRAAVAEFSRKVVSAWAGSSSDEKVESLALQWTAGRKWGGIDQSLTPNEMARQIANNTGVARQVEEFVESNGPLLDATLDAMYENTQKKLREQGIEEVLVYRGMRFSGMGDEVPDWAAGHSYRSRAGARERVVSDESGSGFVFGAKVNMNPLSSWSTDWSTAQSFSSESKNGIVMAARVPASEVVGTARTGFGCLNEHEMVLRGGWDKDIEAGLRWIS